MMPIITPNDSTRPSSRPFVINNDTGTTGATTGDDQARNYCDLPRTEASRYHLGMPDHQYISQFQSAVSGVTKFAYCLDKFAGGPYNDVPYQSAPFETIFPDAITRQKQMLTWIMANAFPVATAHRAFALADVNDSASPSLDGNGAYAAVRVVPWVPLG